MKKRFDEKCRKLFLARKYQCDYSIYMEKINERVLTMERNGYSLTREFSHLGRFQQAHTLCYALRQEDGGLTVSITRTQDARQQTQKISLAAWKPEEAELLLRYLYENAVPIENWQDVVADLTTALSPREE